MALLTATRPTAAGTVLAGAAVSSSDTIQASDLGNLGAYLIVTNGNASSDTVAIVDGGFTPAGNAGVSTGGPVAASTSRAFFVSPKLVNQATGVVTVTHTTTATVTYQLLPLG